MIDIKMLVDDLEAVRAKMESGEYDEADEAMDDIISELKLSGDYKKATQVRNKKSAKNSKHCLWTYEEDTDSWDTSCGNKHCLTDGIPKDNQMEFCCYCGNVLREQN